MRCTSQCRIVNIIVLVILHLIKRVSNWYFFSATFKTFCFWNSHVEFKTVHTTCAFRGIILLFTITKTRLFNFDPLKPHFYIVKLGFTGVYIIFLISAHKHRLWVHVRTASLRRFQRVPTIYVWSRNTKNIRIFFLKIFIFGGKIFSIFK